ncbi:hypothetical protein [Pantoea eucrina]|uniref:hypothetical protein n=1 Tax=Pantoea eucrina TaxID=472693 RepID=UPI002FD9A05D
MKSSFDEKLMEIVLGEAVTELLEAREAVTWHALLDRLHIKVNTTADTQRLQAGTQAIEHIRNEMRLRLSLAEDSSDTVLFSASCTKTH